MSGESFNLSLVLAIWRVAMMICLVSFILAIICLVLYINSEKNTSYEIKHSTGIFFFKANAYPKEELTAFSKAVADLKDTSV